MNNHWQLKTTPVSKKEDDKLSHDSIAELLKEKIDYLFLQDDIPSCICLNGEYGSGKSTIINLLFKKWEGATNKKVVHFNIWRYKDENTYYALFRNIFYALRNKEKIDFRNKNFLESLTETEEILNLDTEFTRLVYASFSSREVDKNELKKGIDDFVSNLPRYLGKLTLGLIKVVLIGSLLISLVGFLIDWAIFQDFSHSVKFAGKLLLLVSTSTTILSFLFKNIFKNIPSLFKLHIQPAESNITLPSISNTEQLQCIFRNLLHKYCNNGKNKKLVIVIEDVDRKHNDEIIQTLNELRTFIDLGKAIFIIPCDLNNIERAFIEAGIDKSEELDQRYIKWKAKDFYSKIFSHVITIPAQCQQDLREFLLNKISVESKKHPLKIYIKEDETLSTLVNILLVNSIKTPREAINIFNRFTLQFEHALKLENDSYRLKKGTISNNVLAYARIYILSTYYGLEKELIKYPELVDWVLQIFRNREYASELQAGGSYSYFDEVPVYAQEYIQYLYTHGIIIPEIEEFISRTEIYSSDLVKPFIYLDETSYSGKVGNEIYNIVLNSLRSRNVNKLKQLLDDNSTEISEVIQRVTNNITYDADFQITLPSLIDIFELLDESMKLPVSNFILEHFTRIRDKHLYSFSSNTITEIFRLGNKRHTTSAKSKYYGILSVEKESITEYCSEEQIFKISISLINALSIDFKYVEASTRDLLKDFVAIPVSDGVEFNQLEKYLELILSMENQIVIKLFDVRLLERCVNDIYGFYENSKSQNQLKSAVNKLISLFIESNKSNVVNSINNLIGCFKVELDGWFLELLKKYQEYFKTKLIATDLLKALKSNILDEYLKEDNYKDNKELVESAIIQFAQLDGYLFKSLKIKSTDGFKSLLSFYKEIIKESSSKDYISFILECIHTHETNASYSFYNLLIEIFVEYISANLWISNVKSEEYQKALKIAHFLVQNNRINSLKDENQNIVRDKLMTQLQTLINQNKANTDQSETIFEFIKELNYAPKFKDLLVKWMEGKNVRIVNNGNPLTYYRDYLKIIDLVKGELSDSYLTQLLNSCLYLILNYRGNVSYTELAWEWVSKIAEINEELPFFKSKILPEIFNNYSNRESYFPDKIKYHVSKILYKFDLSENINQQSQYVEILLWAADEYNDLVDLFETDFRLFNFEQKYRGLQLISKYKKWEVLEEMIPSENKDLENLAQQVILKKKNLSLIIAYFDSTSTKLNWGLIITETIKEASVNKSIDYAPLFNELPNEIIKGFDKSKVNREVDDYIIDLLREGIDTKFIALNLIDKLNIEVTSDSEILYSIISEFINVIDVNTEIETLRKLKEWIKKHGITRKTNINNKFREIAKVADENNRMEIESLIKY